MSKFTVNTTPINGLLIIEPIKYGESRDYFFELTDQEIFKELGIENDFVQNCVEKYPRGLMRGLHFQRENPQGKLITVLSGAVLDIAVDLRPDSETYGASHSVELSLENERMFYIPPYFAHGFLTLEPQTELAFKTTYEHNSETESGVLWNDQILAINWQFERYDIEEKRLNISKKDKKRMPFRHLDPKTLWK